MGGFFGGGGGGSAPPPPPPPPEPQATGPSAADKERQRRIGRAQLIASDQRGQLSSSSGRNVLTAV